MQRGSNLIKSNPNLLYRLGWGVGGVDIFVDPELHSNWCFWVVGPRRVPHWFGFERFRWKAQDGAPPHGSEPHFFGTFYHRGIDGYRLMCGPWSTSLFFSFGVTVVHLIVWDYGTMCFRHKKLKITLLVNLDY